jgi:epoxyqueuosine reductase
MILVELNIHRRSFRLVPGSELMVGNFAKGVIKSMASEFLWDTFEQKAKNLGFSQVGYASLASSAAAQGVERYRQWLQENHHGEMKYLEEHLPLKENPQRWHAGLKSAFVFSFPYLPHPAPGKSSSLRIALYAQGEDYHFWLQAKLEELRAELQRQFPQETFLCATDSKPVLERDLAQRAGLGWFGKNTCLIQRGQGSFFLLGEILTSLELEKKVALSADFCGSCTRCLDICPTGALEAPRKLNATKCISYLTIESPTVPAEELRRGIGDWFFGCDLCQSVCPWNQKIFKETLDVAPRRELNPQQKMELVAELREILRLSGKQLLKKYAASPLPRAGHRGLRRNALVVIANLQLVELAEEVKKWQSDEKLGELALWTLQALRSEI